MTFEELSPDLQEKAKACTTTEDILALAKAEGYDITDDELATISGGLWCGEDCSAHSSCEHEDCLYIYPA